MSYDAKSYASGTNGTALGERWLDQMQVCRLMTRQVDPELYEDSQTYTVAVKTLRWGLRESFEGRVPNRRILRERYTAVWKSSYYPELGPGPAPAHHPAFWKGVRVAAGVAARIHRLLTSFVVVHPEEPYQFVPDVNPIFRATGSYALLRRKTVRQFYVLNYHANRPVSAPAPTASEAIRWLQALKEPSLRGNLGSYHLVLMRGESWCHTGMDPAQAEYMLNFLASTRQMTVASPGGHCKECLGKRCLTIYG